MMWESLVWSYCEGSHIICIFSRAVKNHLLLFVIHLTPLETVPGCVLSWYCFSHTTSVCVLLSWSFPCKSRTAHYLFCHQSKQWQWPVWWMEMFTYFFESDKPRTLVFLRRALTPVTHAFTRLLKQFVSELYS